MRSSVYSLAVWANRLLATAVAFGILGVIGVGVGNVGVRSETFTIVGLVLLAVGSLSMSASFGVRAWAVKPSRAEERRYLLASLALLIPPLLVGLRLLLRVMLSPVLFIPMLVLLFAVFVGFLYWPGSQKKAWSSRER